jgi:hypothetical protein
MRWTAIDKCNAPPDGSIATSVTACCLCRFIGETCTQSAWERAAALELAEELAVAHAVRILSTAAEPALP